MFNRKLMMQQQKPLVFNKGNSSYRKLEKAMKEPAREYEQIKQLVENNDIEILNKKSKNDIKLIPHQTKNNIKFKK